MKKNLLILLAAALSSCSVLTESQIKNINAFGLSAKSYAAFPGAVLKKRAALHYNEAIVRTMQLATPELMKQNLDHAEAAYNKAMQLSDSFDLSLQLIQQYAGLLARLSTESFVEDVNTNATALGENLSGLVQTFNTKLPQAKLPAGVGAAVSKAIFLVGARLTRKQQAKELKAFIPQGDKIVQASVKNLIDVLDADTPSLKGELEAEKQTFINTYSNIILANPSRVTYSTVRQYTETLADYNNLEALRKQCVEAAGKLATAHALLTKNIARKMALPEIFKETQELITSVQGLYKLFNALHNSQPS